MKRRASLGFMRPCLKKPKSGSSLKNERLKRKVSKVLSLRDSELAGNRGSRGKGTKEISGPSRVHPVGQAGGVDLTLCWKAVGGFRVSMWQDLSYVLIKRISVPVLKELLREPRGDLGDRDDLLQCPLRTLGSRPGKRARSWDSDCMMKERAGSPSSHRVLHQCPRAFGVRSGLLRLSLYTSF